TERNVRTAPTLRRPSRPLDRAAVGRPLARVPGERVDLALDDRDEREPHADPQESRRGGGEDSAAEYVADAQGGGDHADGMPFDAAAQIQSAAQVLHRAR